MVQLRASRRKPTTISSDNEDDIKPQGRGTGKLKPVQKDKQQLPTPLSPTNGSSQSSTVKGKASVSKNSAAINGHSKTGGKTIASFFSAATQQQQTFKRSASPEKLVIQPDEPEAIEDDSDDGRRGKVHLTKDSSTALALRKRKLPNGERFEDNFGSSQPGSQKFRKASSGERVPTLSIINEDKRPWTVQFAPKDLSELAVHKKKVSDIRQWIDMAINGRRQRVLVLKGAAGTGKTTTIQLLARDMNVDVMEWRNPAAVEMGSDGTGSTGAQFAEFVGRAGRTSGLSLVSDVDDESTAIIAASNTATTATTTTATSQREKTLLLVEEFPNTFSRTSNILQTFRSTIMQYLSSPPIVHDAVPTPIVMIISETLLSTNTALADSFTAHRLLGPELNHHPYLDIIEFNAVAPTYLNKALEAIVVKEARKSGRRRTPGPQVLKHIAESGDIRSAISSLEFLCLRGDDGDTWSNKVSFGKQKKSKTDPPLTQSEVDALKLISNRESTLGIFHAVGKVVYNKRIEASSIPHPPPWLPQHRRDKVPENDADQMIDELGTDVSTFIAALHENYVLSCGSTNSEESLDSLTASIDSVSDADLLSVDRFTFGTKAYSGTANDSLRQDEMAFQVAVRGIMFSLPNPVHRSVATEGRKADAHKMFYPASLKLWRRREEIEGVLDLLFSRFQAGRFSASSSADSGATTGVESWKRNAPPAQAAEHDVEGNASTITNSMKTEMLIERLPYMAHIIGSISELSAVAEQVTTVTRIRGAVPIPDDDEADVDEQNGVLNEQWATDKPEADRNLQSPIKKRKVKETLTANEGHVVPIDSRIEKLVLEEDDIVDDFD